MIKAVLFNSYPFLFGFLPLALAAYFLSLRIGEGAGTAVILAASLFFYGWWDWRFLLLLCSSIIVNYLIGRCLARSVEQGGGRGAGMLLAAGVSFNLVLLGIFKYAHFFLSSINAVAGTGFTLGAIILPLGISFFTFEQIGYLTDIRRGHRYKADLLRYAVFVSFFPRLVAGPILRYNEIVPQLAPGARRCSATADIAVGLTIFFIGLVKKSVLADGIAPHVASGFTLAATGAPVDFFLAWGSALAYTCQLYFDFSGYSDMAIGAARCFGIRFPMNFFSPYKATNVIDFWRRWHITLSRFLRDYLYIPLGGNRRGTVRRYANLMITMLLGGLWHGAAWTFVLWGGLHGGYLMVNHGWVALAKRSAALDRLRRSRLGAAGGFVLTFLAVVVAWVFFRAPTFEGALNMVAGMAGQSGVTLPAGLAFALRPAQHVLATFGITFAGGSGTQFIETYLWVVALLALAFLSPSTQELLAGFDPVLDMKAKEVSAPRRMRLDWRLSPGWAVATGTLAFLGVISITRVSEFLYWQF